MVRVVADIRAHGLKRPADVGSNGLSPDRLSPQGDERVCRGRARVALRRHRPWPLVQGQQRFASSPCIFFSVSSRTASPIEKRVSDINSRDTAQSTAWGGGASSDPMYDGSHEEQKEGRGVGGRRRSGAKRRKSPSPTGLPFHLKRRGLPCVHERETPFTDVDGAGFSCMKARADDSRARGPGLYQNIQSSLFCTSLWMLQRKST